MEHQNEHRMEVRGSKGVSRIEILDGPTGRRRWPDDLKARIVAESFQPGARVCDVAAKYGLIARHLSGWRGQARKGELVVPVDVAPTFVPLVIEPLADAAAATASADTGVIRVEICGAVLLTTFGSRARIGTQVSDLYAGPTSRFDLGNALVVDLLTGTLESVTDLTLFGGANALAIESAPGTWEIVQAGAAELLAPGRYRLTRLLRGQRGTEGTMGNPAPAGARVVVLDDSLASLPIAEADLGIPWNWRIGPASRPVSDETYVTQAFTPEGAGLRPFSVAHVEQPWRKPRSTGDVTIRWTRRSRALAADSWGGLEVPMAEELEAYEVELLDGATVKRVLSTATTSAVYTAAEQTADWGAPLGPGDSLTVRIAQLGQLFGAGAANLTTLWF